LISILREAKDVKLTGSAYLLIFGMFIENSQRCYNPDTYYTIDEHLFPIKSRCPFIQFMGRKLDKYGVKC